MSEVELSVFNFEEVAEYVELASFRFALIALSNDKIAIATSKYLTIMEDTAHDSFHAEKVQTVVEFGESSGRPTAIQWLNHDVLCIGFENGGLACFNNTGETIVDHEFAPCTVTSIRVSYHEDQAVGPVVWALYENGYLVSVPVEHLLAGGGIDRYYLKFKLVDHNEVCDFLLLPSPFNVSIFEDQSSTPNTSFLVSGFEPALSLYSIGGKQHFQHIGKLASYVKEKVGSAISKTVGSALNSFFGITPDSDDVDHTPISSVLDFNDAKRRILRLCLDPRGKLVAAADAMGRVLLFDTRLATVAIRVWKGVRDARLAWSEAKSSNSSNGITKALYLAIYAPQIGLLTIWEMKHGPCLRNIPVGPQCNITTILDSSVNTESQYRCALFRTKGNKITVSTINPLGKSDEDMAIFQDDNMESIKDISSPISTVSEPVTPINSTNDTDIEDIKNLNTIDTMLRQLPKKPMNAEQFKMTVEHKLWVAMSGLRNIQIILQVMSIVEKTEIELYLNSRTSGTVDTVSGFSLQFHRNTCRLIEEAAKDHKSTPESNNYNLYAESRSKLVKAYELLCEISAQTNLASFASMPAPGTEKNKWLKQNGVRAEALCWAARRIALTPGHQSNQQLATTQSQMPPLPSLSRSITGNFSIPQISLNEKKSTPESSRRSGDSAKKDSEDENSLSDPGSFGSFPQPAEFPSVTSSPKPPLAYHSPVKSRSNQNSPLPPHHQSANNNSPSISTQQTTSTGNSTVLPCFSVFLHFHIPGKASNECATKLYFQYEYFFSLLRMHYSNPSQMTIPTMRRDSSAGTSQHSILPKRSRALSFEGPQSEKDSNYAPTVPESSASWRPPTWIAPEVLNFIFIALVGDVFTMQRFQAALDIIGLGGGRGLQKSIPLFLAFMESQPLTLIFNSLINRPLSSSPFQRWLRDTLLAFQPFLSGEDDSDGCTDNSPETDTSASAKQLEYTPLELLLEQVIASRSPITPTESDDAAPTIDEIVRHVLRPAWRHARNSVYLECMMIATAQILEVVDAVSDQLERRSFGEISLNMTKTSWSTVIRQLRVALLLSSRAGGVISINRLGSGEVSIYSLLAEDTLCFAMQADQAIEHEMRCQEVFDRRSNLNAPRSTSSSDGLGALLAWGPVADARWKELVAVAEAEDAMSQDSHSTSRSSSTGGNSVKKIKRRRPLLLFFPSHNQATPLAAYRAFSLVNRWYRKPKKVEMLSLAATHLLSLPPMTRAAVCERVCTLFIMPLIRAYIELEEGITHNAQGTSSVQELMVVMAEPEAAEALIQGVADFITYSGQSTVNSTPNTTPMKGKESSKEMETNAINNELDDERNPDVWPPCIDPKLSTVVKKFQLAGGIKDKVVRLHLCLMWALLLRTQCGLRGVKPSQLFGSKLLQVMCTYEANNEIGLGNWTQIKVDDAHHAVEGQVFSIKALNNVREEFIQRCFRRLEGKPALLVYSMASIWDMDPQLVKLMHLSTLLELGLDNIVGDLISQHDSYDIMDKLTEGIRARFGQTVAYLEKIPACGSLLASLDSDASAWARAAIGAPDRATIEAIYKGKSKLINYDVPSTRHLVIRIQGVLLSVAAPQRDAQWIERKNKCDALLSLCSSMSTSNLNSYLKGSGLLI